MTSNFEPTVMPGGESAGLFDSECNRLREITKARCVAVIVIDGEPDRAIQLWARLRRRFCCRISCRRWQISCADSFRKICSNLPVATPHGSSASGLSRMAGEVETAAVQLKAATVA